MPGFPPECPACQYSEQVREPIYTDAVEFWKHYESQLESIREILAPVMPR